MSIDKSSPHRQVQKSRLSMSCIITMVSDLALVHVEIVRMGRVKKPNISAKH